jgi:hypothetical protein
MNRDDEVKTPDRYKEIVHQIAARDPIVRAKSDEALRAMTDALEARQRPRARQPDRKPNLSFVPTPEDSEPQEGIRHATRIRSATR